jgi:hypothetical protein
LQWVQEKLALAGAIGGAGFGDRFIPVVNDFWLNPPLQSMGWQTTLLAQYPPPRDCPQAAAVGTQKLMDEGMAVGRLWTLVVKIVGVGDNWGDRA